MIYTSFIFFIIAIINLKDLEFSIRAILEKHFMDKLYLFNNR